jgi:MFS family permease
MMNYIAKLSLWLMRADRQVEFLDENQFQEAVQENYRRNFILNVLDGSTFWFGASFMASATIVPLFISKLTSSTFPIGVAAVISGAGWSLPQLFTANYTEKFGRMKPLVINLGLLTERFPLFFMILAALLATKKPLVALFIFLLSLAWHVGGAGVVAPAWQTLLSRMFPVERRGRVMGVTMFVGAGTGVLGSLASAWVLDNIPFPFNFVALFGIAALFIHISWIALALVREPIPRNGEEPQNNRQFWKGLGDILKSDHNYRRFLISRGLAGLGGMGFGFVTVAAVRTWGVADQTVGYYTMANLAGQTLGNLFFGWLADQKGHKLPLEIGTLTGALAFLIAWVAPTPDWYYLVFVLLGLTNASLIVSGIMIVMEFSTPQRVPTYTGLTNTALGVFSGIAPLLGAWIADMSFDLLFAISSLLSFLGLIMLFTRVQEPRRLKQEILGQVSGLEE